MLYIARSTTQASKEYDTRWRKKTLDLFLYVSRVNPSQFSYLGTKDIFSHFGNLIIA